jgi:hypothetical protein
MSIFDMGKNMSVNDFGKILGVRDGSTEGNTWQMVTGWTMIGNRFYGDSTDFVRSVRDKLSKLPHVPLSRQDTLDVITYLERTALELRQLIGED